MAADCPDPLAERASVREVAFRYVAGGAGYLAVGTQARIKKEFLSQCDRTRVIGDRIGGVGRHGAETRQATASAALPVRRRSRPAVGSPHERRLRTLARGRGAPPTRIHLRMSVEDQVESGTILFPASLSTCTVTVHQPGIWNFMPSTR